MTDPTRPGAPAGELAPQPPPGAGLELSNAPRNGPAESAPGASGYDPADSEDALDSAVQGFALHLACGEQPDPASFAEGHPECDPRLLEARCREALRVRETLRVHAAGLGVGEGTFAPGRTVGDFRVLTELGRGGMGVVLLAYQESLGRKVALKVLPLNPVVSSRALKRFRREALAIARLRHAGIVQVHAVGEEGETLFLVLEFVEGWSLARHLEHGLNNGEAAGWKLGSARERGYAGRVATLVASVAEALDYAHARGIVHRDVKPGNILIDQEGAPHLSDFGLAQDASDESISRTGDLAGTPFYMSPEQAAATAQLDSRSDIFSLGVVLYELLTRRRPFGGDSLPQILTEITTHEPLPIRKLNAGVPRDLVVICHKALEKAPDDRYATAGALAKDLRHFLAHEAIDARPPSRVEQVRRALVRRRRLVVMIVALLLAPLVWVGARSLWFGTGWEGQAGDAMRAAMGLPALDSSSIADVDEFVLGASWAREVLADDGVAKELKDLAEQVQARAVLEAGLLFDRGRADLVRSADSFAYPDPVERQSLGFNGHRLMDRARALTSFADGELFDLDEALLPTLSVTTDPPAARIELVRLDPLTNFELSRESLGTAPVALATVQPGFYRIVAYSADGTAELSRWLRRAGVPFKEHIVVRPVAETRAGMRLVEVDPDAPFPVGGPHGPLDGERYGSPPVVIPSYWIDEREVSCAEYRVFLLDTERPPPKGWPEPYDARNDDLPVVCLTFAEAQVYAEWAGKRLPTWFEWERAARGTQGLLYPEGKEFDPALGRAIGNSLDFVDVRSPEEYSERLWAHMRSVVHPVGCEEEGSSPEGLLHTSDNVKEWTESPAIGLAAGQQRHPIEGRWILKGGWWGGGRERLDAILAGNHGDDHRGVGLRCAKSQEP